MTGNKNAMFLDTLAMAHAELGQFDQALAAVRGAASLRPDDPGLASRIALYQTSKPFRRETR
jgi:Flp pilus assembly protein TadD